MAGVVGNASAAMGGLQMTGGLMPSEPERISSEWTVPAAGDPTLIIPMAGVDHQVDPIAAPGQPSVLLLLDTASGVAIDVERYVSQLLADARIGKEAGGVIVTPVELECPGHTRWLSVVVPDIGRVAAALGVLSLPAVLASGSVDETRQTIEAILQRQARGDCGRVSGALSTADLR
ncbi:MAG: hypothetical protein QM589_05060 [Thermomicrobiales bacterium]